VFHGWRGENEQAKRAAKWHHTYYTAQFSRPVYEFRLDFTLDALRAKSELAPLIAQAEAKGTLRAVRAQPRAWPYVDPKTDREADSFGIEKGIQSPQAVLGERGVDLDDLIRERCDAIASARKAAKDRAKAEKEPDAWRAYCLPWALDPTEKPAAPGAAAPPKPTKPTAPAGKPEEDADDAA
jgi:capsid protein